MKKVIWIIVLVICLFGCHSSNEMTKYLDSITLTQYNDMKKDKQDFIVYIARPECSDCSFFEISFKEDLKNNYSLRSIKYLDVTKLHKDKERWNKFKEYNQIQGTPSFISIKSGEIDTVYTWSEDNGFDYDVFIKWFSKL